MPRTGGNDLIHWSVREHLSLANRLRRSYYELLRDDLDQLMLRHSLVDSYKQFLAKKKPYPFVEKREFKPRARIPDVEYKSQNSALVIFMEGSLPATHKKYIRFFDGNKTTKTNLTRSKSLPLLRSFDRTQKYFDSVHFLDFMELLMPVDYALLIQREPGSHLMNRYILSHFHVRVDWPIADAAEDLARNLRYISKDIYEKGDKYADNLQKKFFEYYGMPVMAGGRRTAAIVAAQYMRQLPCITTVYVSSSEARALFRFSERGVSKAALTLLTELEMEQLSDANKIKLRTMKKNYVIGRHRKKSLCIFQAIYQYTDSARPPDDGKLRELKPDLYWLTVGDQLILPKPGCWKYPPLQANILYSS